MNHEDAKIKARLEEVMQSTFCPFGGCWYLHRGHYEYYYDEGSECHSWRCGRWDFMRREKREGTGGSRKISATNSPSSSSAK